MREERECFFVCYKLDIYYSLNSIIHWMARTHSTRMQWWSRLFSKVEILAPNRLNILSLFYRVQWSPVQKETVGSLISGHHWGNNICPLIVGVLLLESLIFLSSMFSLPREGDLKGSEFLQSFTRFLGQTLVFMCYSALREKFNFCFLEGFLPVSTKLSFREEYWVLDKNSMKFQDFLNIS